MKYTVHFMDQEWNIQTWCLQIHFIPVHDADNLAGVVVETIEHFSQELGTEVFG